MRTGLRIGLMIRRQGSVATSDTVIERYQLSSRQRMFRADATDLWSLGEQLNLHALRCNADPAVMFQGTTRSNMVRDGRA